MADSGQTPSADVVAKRQYTTAAIKIALTTTAADNSAGTLMKAGILHLVWADVAWHFRHTGSAAVAAATTNDSKLGAYQPLEVYCSGTATDVMSGILDSGTGTCYIQPVGP